jgi:integral membrane sensor domain MASE1
MRRAERIKDKTSMRRFLESLTIFIAVVAAAKFASMMTVSEQFMSPVWLPAAVCLTALIWLGNRALPAIALSTGFLGWVVARDNGGLALGSMAASLVIVGTAAGATLQAVAGRYLIRRFVSREAEVETAYQFFRLLLIAPAAGLVSPIIGARPAAWFLGAEHCPGNFRYCRAGSQL